MSSVSFSRFICVTTLRTCFEDAILVMILVTSYGLGHHHASRHASIAITSSLTEGLRYFLKKLRTTSGRLGLGLLHGLHEAVLVVSTVSRVSALGPPTHGWYCILEISTMKSGYSICLVGSYAVLDAESSDGRADIVIHISMHSTYNYLHGLRLYSLQDP